MKGDFTSFGFDRSKHFSRVLQQQGRVALDSDANESTAITLHQLRRLTRDLFGAFGGPANSGFALTLDKSGKTPVLRIAPGHYYVEGILCENEEWADYAHQPDYEPSPPDASGEGGDILLAALRNPDDEQRFWIYLDVWERHVTWIEDDSIREPALGGPDTCTRAKVIWQVKVLAWNTDWDKPAGTNPCLAPMTSVQIPSSARLSARVDPGAAFTDPCVVPASALYRGTENHLYRVEIQRGGSAGTATFKWSRDNGSVATRWLGTEGRDLVVLRARGFSAGDWVELSHDALDLAGQPGQLLHVSAVDGDRLTIDAASMPASGVMSWSESLSNPKVRRWDQRANDDVELSEGAVPVVESGWIDLEDGVQVEFSAGGEYRSGDYWVIPARVATGGIEWPEQDGQPSPLPPRGIEHHVAPLGVLSLGDDESSVTPCRRCVAVSATECTAVAPPVPVEKVVLKPAPKHKAVRTPRRRRPT